MVSPPIFHSSFSDGFAVGVITACNKRPAASGPTAGQPSDFTADDELLLESLSVHFGVMLANCLTHEKGMAERRKANALVQLAVGTGRWRWVGPLLCVGHRETRERERELDRDRGREREDAPLKNK